MQIRKKMRVNYSKAEDLFGFKYAFYKHTRLSVLEKIKNKKKFFREQFYSKAKIFRKNFFTKIENRQRSGGRVKRGMVYYSTQYINTSTKRTYRTYIVCVFRTFVRVCPRWSVWLRFLRLLGRF